MTVEGLFANLFPFNGLTEVANVIVFFNTQSALLLELDYRIICFFSFIFLCFILIFRNSVKSRGNFKGRNAFQRELEKCNKVMPKYTEKASTVINSSRCKGCSRQVDSFMV